MQVCFRLIPLTTAGREVQWSKLSTPTRYTREGSLRMRLTSRGNGSSDSPFGDARYDAVAQFSRGYTVRFLLSTSS